MAARSLNSVEKALSKMSLKPPNPKVGNDYLKCRYGDMPSSTVRVPDGLGRNLTTNDYLSTYDISATGPFSLLVTPTYPQQGIAYCPTGSSLQVGAFNVPPTTIRTLASPTLAALLEPVATVSTRDAGSAGRIISQRWKITYTGAASTCQGLLQANSNPLRMDSDPRINPSTVEYTDGTAAAGTLSPGRCDVAVVDIQSPDIPLTPNRNTVINRPEHGMHGFLRRNVGAKAHTFKPMWQQQCVLIRDTTLQSANSKSIFGAIGAAGVPTVGVITLDHDFDYERIDLVIASTIVSSWRLEIVTCFEIEHPNNFTYISLTSNAAPVDERILHVDDMLNQTMVHAAPISQSVIATPSLPSNGRQTKRKQPRRKRNKRVGNKPRKPRARRAPNARTASGPVINNFK